MKRKKIWSAYLKKLWPKNFPYLRKKVNIKLIKAQQNASKVNLKRLTYLTYSEINYNKTVKSHNKERILKAGSEKCLLTYKRGPIRIL